VTDLSISEARRVALAAQGFDRPRPSGPIRPAQVRRTIRRLGLLQLDFVNAVIPAHYQVLFSRLGPYETSLLDDLVYHRHEFTEQWAHEASLLPVESWPLLRHRMERRDPRSRELTSFMDQHPDYADWVLGEVRSRGPLGAADLPETEDTPRRASGVWGSVPRAVLEAHFSHGLLGAAGRKADQSRVYDLAERLIPPEHFHRELPVEEAQRELIRLAARAYGVATVADLADYYRMPVRDARLRVAELLERSELAEVRVEGWREPAYLYRGASRPRRIRASALLSPFDPVVWYRDRAARLFDFEYRIEIYVPPAKRRWGYYVLPFLLGDRLVGRVDLKADRKKRRLLVPAAHIEPHADPGDIADALAAELRALACWLDLDGIDVGDRGDLAPLLARAAGSAAALRD